MFATYSIVVRFYINVLRGFIETHKPNLQVLFNSSIDKQNQGTNKPKQDIVMIIFMNIEKKSSVSALKSITPLFYDEQNN